MDGAQGMYVKNISHLIFIKIINTIFKVSVGCMPTRSAMEMFESRRSTESTKVSTENPGWTYARILVNIDEEYSQDAFPILQWLVYSARPLRIQEVAEVIAIDTDESRFDPDNRLEDSSLYIAISAFRDTNRQDDHL